ncbi:MAG: insulinase family protein [Acidobacteriia bacterium]|nr:insulinase family protein [Terriglobia bacterium]
MKLKREKYWMWITATLLFLGHTAYAQQFDIKTHQLKNGMKILILEDHSIPNVALYFFHRVGSRNEHTGITGLSHFFEHMMFNGAKKYGPGMFDRVMEDNGGSNNAYTSEDLTVYQDWFPTAALPLIFDLEADRTGALSFDPKMVESERGVVANERRLSVENNNEDLLREQLMAAAFTAHPYHWPVVGWMVDIENWKREDLIDYFKTYYAPNNCEMVIVGDIQSDRVIRLAQQYLESIPAQEPPRPVSTREPEQLGERRVFVHKFAQLPLLQVAYHAPAAVDPDFIPLSVLDYILLRGESSRLYQRLVDKEQVAVSVGGGQSEHIDPFIFEIDVQPRSGVEVDRVEKVLYDELDKTQKSLVEERELQKAKNTAVADFYRSMKTINGKANVLGVYDVVFGDYHKLFKEVELINQVTREDLQRVAQKYFTPRNRTVAILVPEPPPAEGK